MSTDRELLELAAKAAGKTLRYNYLGTQDARCAWDPLNDDGDTFRLETKMSFTVVFWPEGVEVGESEFVRGQLRHVISKSAYEPYSHHGGDKNAARRKAATHAAAKIGRAMP